MSLVVLLILQVIHLRRLEQLRKLEAMCDTIEISAKDDHFRDNMDKVVKLAKQVAWIISNNDHIPFYLVYELSWQKHSQILVHIRTRKFEGKVFFNAIFLLISVQHCLSKLWTRNSAWNWQTYSRLFKWSRFLTETVYLIHSFIVCMKFVRTFLLFAGVVSLL